jgi:hypothetical protein
VPTTYYNTDGGISWGLGVRDEIYEPDYAVTTLWAPDTLLRPGKAYSGDWNRAPVGPCFGSGGPHQWGVAWNTEELRVHVPLRCDRAGHVGFAETDEGRTTVHRDGKLVREVLRVGLANVPLKPEPGTYRIAVDAAHSPAAPLGKHSTIAWTVKVTGPGTLPLSVLRFAPELDANGAAASGPARVPVRTQAQPGATVPPVRTVKVEVSYDDGANWQPAKVTGANGQYSAELLHPVGAFVSLRSTATDTAGTVVEQTSVRAYRTAG